MLPASSTGIRYIQLELSQARSLHTVKLNRLLLKFRELWKGEVGLQRPRRSIDRELQESESMDLP